MFSLFNYILQVFSGFVMWNFELFRWRVFNIFDIKGAVLKYDWLGLLIEFFLLVIMWHIGFFLKSYHVVFPFAGFWDLFIYYHMFMSVVDHIFMGHWWLEKQVELYGIFHNNMRLLSLGPDWFVYERFSISFLYFFYTFVFLWFFFIRYTRRGSFVSSCGAKFVADHPLTYQGNRYWVGYDIYQWVLTVPSHSDWGVVVLSNLRIWQSY